MLVLTRHCGEQIIIGEDIVVTIVAVEGSKVRIGVEAPRSVRVDRAEIHARRVAENGVPQSSQRQSEVARREPVTV